MLILASVVDDRSGVSYQEYVVVRGENTITALRFLFNAMLLALPPLVAVDNSAERAQLAAL